VFWTDAVPDSSVAVEFDEGKAELRVRHLCVLDTFTTANSNDQTHPLGHPVAAVINSLKLRWSGISRRTSFTSTDPQDHFAGDFIENSATIEVDVTTLPSTGHGFHFVSDPASTTVSNFAQIGRERNGSFV
jgi:hypothetical protein